jgi:urease accessory protein
VAAGREGLLDVALGAGVCVASRVRFGYPLKLMVPAHLDSMAPPERAAAAGEPLPRPVWCYVVGYGGGLVAGDAAALSVRVAPGATAVLATQASTKVYHARARGQPPAAAAGGAEASSPSAPAPAGRPAAVSSLAASVGSGGLLAVLPDPVMAFADARFRQRQSVALAPGGSLVLLDWCSSGRRARGEAWAFASYESRTEVLLQRTAGGPACPLLVDALRLQRSPAAPLPERMGRAHVVGVLILTGPRRVCVCVREGRT